MAESLRRLVNIGTFSVLQEKLEKWLSDYYVSISMLIFKYLLYLYTPRSFTFCIRLSLFSAFLSLKAKVIPRGMWREKDTLILILFHT